MSDQWSEIHEVYDRDGFVIVREFLAADELLTLQNELYRYIREVVPSRPSSDVFYADLPIQIR
ncbi:hypothetical protein DTL21_27100 [Bremerella cremea]|uniref:Phytanoyl-CoA dioxygenase n=1 Tax=Blastopirellula marina TaxID=124 RepID=A0A2S8FC33_9BACT|nr:MULTISPECIES: hypothetical protein [Pirellulaceae]PQO29707.1 hypothetical protein C5Y83_27055 [Blastopirellula marina]RCS43009.1 hypothetical protein DTL21_27100 [Bremerella cremea]